MFHVDRPAVRELLLKGHFGLEKESLRVLQNGSMSHSPHPFPGEKHIVRDFCENQTEINTSVYDNPEEAVEALWNHTIDIQKRLAKLSEPELLWPFSNPPFIRNEEDIPVAKFYGDEASKTEYRYYLSDRYGRYKMTLSGIHVNYSFAEELLKADFEESGETDFRVYKDQLYLELAEKAAAFGWIVTAVTAASPLMESSYLEKGRHGGTTFQGMSSTRCSELGYWNYFTPVFDYSNLDNYTDSIQRYVDNGFIAAPSELYYPIRLKPPGKNDLMKLKVEGVDHIELRNVDLNPYEKAGLDIRDLKFIQLFLVWLASSIGEEFSLKAQVQAAQNFKNAAHYDLKTVKILAPNGKVFSVADAGLSVIGFMRSFYEGISMDDVSEILDFEEAKFIDPEQRYAWRFRHEFGDDFMGLGLQYARKQQQEAMDV